MRIRRLQSEMRTAARAACDPPTLVSKDLPSTQAVQALTFLRSGGFATQAQAEHTSPKRTFVANSLFEQLRARGGSRGGLRLIAAVASPTRSSPSPLPFKFEPCHRQYRSTRGHWTRLQGRLFAILRIANEHARDILADSELRTADWRTKMGLLTDTSLRARIQDEHDPSKLGADRIGIAPFSEDSLTPVGYDLRIGDEYSVSTRAEKRPLEKGAQFRIAPGETVFISSLERLTMPTSKLLSGLVVSKVSLTAQGMTNDTTTVDPDWSGNLLLVMHNMSKKAVLLRQGQAICTLVFLENAHASTKPSLKDNNRNALLLKLWSEINSSARRTATLRTALAPSLIMASFVCGLFFFQNNPGLVASVAVGVALSQFVRDAR